ncbi:MAG TPA: hypothetical protein VNZ64_17450 [Candidatus Acidoferrum sp.]|jgi:hypothetical protein|nr:hypothetical protein [Candidatus Acidoferrum sp.]
MTIFPGPRSGRDLTLLAVFLAAGSLTAGGADVAYYLVAKGMAYRQTGSALPAPKGNPARFIAQVGLSAANTATNATVQSLPGGTVTPLTLGVGGHAGVNDTFEFQAKFSTQSLLDASYPNGNYQMVIGAVHDGLKTLTLALNTNAYPSSTPYLTNPVDPGFNMVIVTNPAAAYTLTWAPFSAGGSFDFIQVTLYDILGNLLFQTPGPGQTGSLNGAAKSLVIPANTLPPGAVVGGTLVFAHPVQLYFNSYSGATGVAAYYTSTDFVLATFAEDAVAYNIGKQQNFNQNSSGAPTPAGGNPFRFFANIFATASNSVTSAQVQLPAPGGIDPLSPDPTDTALSFVQRFPSQTALDTTYIAGTYTLQLSAVHDGSRALQVTMPSDSFPVAPHVANWAAAQNVNPAADFNLTWDPFSGSSGLDFIVFNAFDSLGNFITSLGLLNTATNFDFVAGTFQSGQAYQVQLQFRHFTSYDITNYPGVSGSVRFFSTTTINLSTTGLATAPALAVVNTNGLRPFELLLTGQAGRLYAIDTSSSLQNGTWTPLVTNTAVNGQFVFVDAQSSNFPARFYRGRAAN